jgi:alpha-L-rhamnosidase
MNVHSLRCEYLDEPLGLDEEEPRLSWICDGEQHGRRVVVLFDARKTHDAAAHAVVWDTGWHASTDCSIVYGGPRLEPRTRYRWTVELRDAGEAAGNAHGAAGGTGNAPDTGAAESRFETGMVGEPWQAEWIKAPSPLAGSAHLFLREIDLQGAVVSARVSLCGIGLSALRVNGRPAGDAVLDPAWTDYRHKLYYVTYDITGHLRPGKNTVAVAVTRGRYRDPTVIASISVTLEDGSRISDGTDRRTWWWSPSTPTTAASIYDGETHDARIRVPGWNAGGSLVPLAPQPAGAELRPLQRPLTAEPPGGRLVGQDLEPIRVMADLTPVRVHEIDERTSVYDLGQNIAGWALIAVRGPAGTEVTLLFSEALRDDGRVEPAMNRGAKATDRYILCGDGEERWEPGFTYHGFRYVEVTTSGALESFELTGRLVRSSVRKAGDFSCADELANRIRTACEWTEADNLHGVPTDCPQREERFGWLNDMTVRAESAMYTFDLGRLYAKWAEDIAHAQGPATGAITDVAPFDPYHARHFGNRPADPVSSSYLLVCWLSYLHYGDRRVLEHRYDGLVRWYEYLRSQSDDLVLRYSYWGDWASPKRYAVEGSVGSGAVSAVTPGALVSSAYLWYDAALLARISLALGRHDDHERFESQAREIADAFDREFFSEERGCYATGSQGAQAIPLALGIVPQERRAPVAQRLVDAVLEADTHLSTGNLASRYVLEALCDHGHTDLAWALATQTSYPSWGYMIEHGATTIWERWEHIRATGMNSHNHPMYATVSGWFSRYVAGIRPSPRSPGFAEVVFRPYPPARLAWAQGSLETVRGRVASSWKREAGQVEYRFQAPRSSDVRIEIPVPPEAEDDPVAAVVAAPEQATGPSVERDAGGSRLIWTRPGGDVMVVIEGET